MATQEWEAVAGECWADTPLGTDGLVLPNLPPSNDPSGDADHRP